MVVIKFMDEKLQQVVFFFKFKIKNRIEKNKTKHTKVKKLKREIRSQQTKKKQLRLDKGKNKK